MAIKPFIPIIFFWIFMIGVGLMYALIGDPRTVAFLSTLYVMVCIVSAGLTYRELDKL